MLAAWLESPGADAVFGWRQILKHKTASSAAILSLALGIGASMAAFRLVDALFLRPLPVAHPENLYAVAFPDLFEGKISMIDSLNYPTISALRAAVQDQAELMAISRPLPTDVTFESDQDAEQVSRQFVSGAMFQDFGLKPALGRLFLRTDDVTPGAAPYAVISYHYWQRRFAKDPRVIGRRFRNGNDLFEVIGVAPEGFTGTEPGAFTDVFIPNMMNSAGIESTAWNAYRAWLRPKPGAGLDQIRERLTAALHSYREQAVKTWPSVRPKTDKDFFVAAPVSLEPAAAGLSGSQHSYRRPLTIFSLLVGLVLLIACINVANLMTAQAAARAREMALRISIGAGRTRLLRLVLIEGALIAIAASALGLAFSWWAPAALARKIDVQLALNAGWRVATFALALTFAITLLFALAPAIRASSVQPVSALKGSDDPHSRRRWMNALIAAQVAFCCFVLYVGGLFISTFQRMAGQPTGFSSDRVLTLDAVSKQPLPADAWYQVAQRLNATPGVESASVAWFALMSFHAQTRFIWANGHVPDGTWSHSAWILGVSPGWFQTMQLPLLAGRDFRWDDEYPQVAVVNEKFAQRYFGDENPVGRSFETPPGMNQTNPRLTMRIVGVVGDARYEDMRLPVPATAYIPLRAAASAEEGRRTGATFLVCTKSRDPMSLAPTLRSLIPATRPEIRVASVVTQEGLVQSQMTRERLLSALSFFFTAIALILAAVGLYGVLNYLVLERRREFGIRIALGAGSSDIAWRVTFGAIAMIVLGAAAGLGLGFESERYVAGLLYHVHAGEPEMLVLPLITLFGAALLAAIPPVLRAIRIDPAALLRAE